MMGTSLLKSLGLLSLIFAHLCRVPAQIIDGQTALFMVVNNFGTPISGVGRGFSEFVRLEASVKYPQGSINDLTEDDVLFTQANGALEPWFPASKGNFIAFAGAGGYINLFCAPTLVTDKDIRSDIEFDFSVFDRGRKAWVNPAFFIKGIQDTIGPQITSLSLERSGVEFSYKDSNNNKKSVPQGTYSIMTSIQDERPKQSSSGLLRVKVVLDGVAVIDNKMDIALAGNNGLSFFGYQAPSSKALGQNSRLKAGEIRLLRGEHSLELFAYDFNGNETVVKWKIRIE